MTACISMELIAKIRKNYHLHWMGTHGIVHWYRVYENGLRLAEQTGVNSRVVQLFSVLHDSRRENEHRDPEHGARGAELALQLRKYIPLDDCEFALLQEACTLHTHTPDHDDITIQACFDSDRLDLGRVGIMPHPDRLCTAMAKEKKIIDWAYHRSLYHNKLPESPFAAGEVTGH